MHRKAWAVAAWLLVVWLALPPLAWSRGSARLRRIERALASRDLRVRLQTLVVLTKLKDRRAVPAVIKLLKDKNPTVRSLAVATLAAIGDRRAVGPIARLRRDKNRRVRRQVKLALAKLRPRKRPPRRARVLVRLGSMGDLTKRAGAIRPLMRQIWRAQIKRAPRGIALLEPGQRPWRHQKVFQLSSSILRIKRVKRGRLVRTTCTVSAVVDRNASIVMMTSGGATVEVSKRGKKVGRRAAERFKTTALENAIASANRNLVSFLRRQ